MNSSLECSVVNRWSLILAAVLLAFSFYSSAEATDSRLHVSLEGRVLVVSVTDPNIEVRVPLPEGFVVDTSGLHEWGYGGVNGSCYFAFFKLSEPNSDGRICSFRFSICESLFNDSLTFVSLMDSTYHSYPYGTTFRFRGFPAVKTVRSNQQYGSIEFCTAHYSFELHFQGFRKKTDVGELLSDTFEGMKLSF